MTPAGARATLSSAAGRVRQLIGDADEPFAGEISAAVGTGPRAGIQTLPRDAHLITHAGIVLFAIIGEEAERIGEGGVVAP